MAGPHGVLAAVLVARLVLKVDSAMLREFKVVGVLATTCQKQEHVTEGAAP